MVHQFKLTQFKLTQLANALFVNLMAGFRSGKLLNLSLEPLAKALELEARKRLPFEVALTKRAFVEVLVEATGDREEMEHVAKDIFSRLTSSELGSTHLLSYPEAVAGLSMHCIADYESASRAVFAAFDANGNGLLDEDELAVMLHSSLRLVQSTKAAALTDAQKRAVATAMAARTFVRVDTDGDGTIDQAEFRVFFLQTRGIKDAPATAPTKASNAASPRATPRATPRGAKRRRRFRPRRGSAAGAAARLTMEKVDSRRLAQPPLQRKPKRRVDRAVRAVGHGLRDALSPTNAASRRMLREGGRFLGRKGEGASFSATPCFVWTASTHSGASAVIFVGHFKGDPNARRIPLRTLVEISRRAPLAVAPRHRATFLALVTNNPAECIVLAACDGATTSTEADAWAEAFAFLCECCDVQVRLRRRGEFVNPLASLGGGWSPSGSLRASPRSGAHAEGFSAAAVSPGAAAAAAKLAAWQPPRMRATSAASRVRAAFHRKEKIRALSRILVVTRKLRLRRTLAVRSPLLAPQSFVCRVDTAAGSWHVREVSFF